jgi:hypothetical protein
MQPFNSFATLADAQAYAVTTYNIIPTSIALAYFLSEGVEEVLHANTNNTTTLNIGTKTVTIGSICRGVLQNTSGFDVDPSKELGQFNLGACAALVGAGMLTQELIDGFIAKGVTITYPYADKTEHEFLVAKGTCPTVLCEKTANNDTALFRIAADTPNHAPRVMTSSGELVGRVFTVRIAGIYAMAIPPQHRNAALEVDDAYGQVTTI